MQGNEPGRYPAFDTESKMIERVVLEPVQVLDSKTVYAVNRWLDSIPSMKRALKETAAELDSILGCQVELEAISCRTMDAASPEPIESCVCFPLEIGAEGLRAFLVVDTCFGQYVVDRLLGGEGRDFEVQRPLTEMERGAVSAVLLRILRKLEQFGLPCTRLTGLGGPVPGFPGGSMLSLQYRIVVGGRAAIVRVLLAGDVLEETCNRSSGFLPEWRGPLLAMQVTMVAELGWAVLSLSQVMDLEPGDLVLFDHLGITDTGAMDRLAFRPLGGTGPALEAAPVPRSGAKQVRIELVGLLEGRMMSMNDSKEQAGVEPGLQRERTKVSDPDQWPAAVIDGLQVRVVLELGRSVLSAREVLSLRPGHVLALDKSGQEEFELTVEGRPIALCELVQVDGRWGARIKRLVAEI